MSKWWQRFPARLAIVLCYLLVFATCLYAPYVFNAFVQQKELNVCAFTNIFSPEAIALFEERTGVRVNMTYAEMDEEIGAKFGINEGRGYDVINVSDFMVHYLSSQGYLRKLDHDKIRNLRGLNKQLLERTFDPHNSYSVPHKWFMYGIVYNKNFFNLAPDQMSLDYIFTDPAELYRAGRVQAPYRVCMIDSPMDAYFLSMLSTFNRCDKFTDLQYQQIASVLSNQKSWVECYTLYTIEYFLLSGVVPIALTSSDFVRRLRAVSDDYLFAIPREGGILVIENLVIPRVSSNSDLAHQFIDFMLSDEIALLNSTRYGWTSANSYASQQLDAQYRQQCGDLDFQAHLFPDAALFARLHIPLFAPYARRQADDAWLRVGFA